MRTAIYIMSCDKNNDVLNHTLLSIKKYFKEFNLNFYIGTNTITRKVDKNYTLIFSNKSSWKDESIQQISEIKKREPTLTHLIVILDDFILNKNVDLLNLYSIINDEKLDTIKYLRLKKIEEPFLRKLLNIFLNKTKIGDLNILKIRKKHPYYFSLQIAIWDINYLLSSIRSAKDIWQFENQVPNIYDHWTLTKNLFNYKHIVEKGKWQYYAKRYCIKYINFFEPKSRELIKDNLKNNIIDYLKRIKFFMFGYIKISSKSIK